MAHRPKNRPPQAGAERPSAFPANLPSRARGGLIPAAALVLLTLASIAIAGLWRVWFPRPAPPVSSAASRGAAAASGEQLYATLCAACHGSGGRGDGPAAPFCRTPPADFTRAEFKVRSTPAGALPTDADLAAVIRRGAGGDGAMPSFAFLRDEDVTRLVAEVKSRSPRWQREPPPPGLVLPPRVAGDARRGEQIYRAWGCVACHGPAGAGDGPRARELRDALGRPERPTDLTRPWTFKGGIDEAGLVRSVLTGFNGTTMPGYTLQPGAEPAVWDLAAYMRGLQQARAPAPPSPVETSTLAGYWPTPVPAQGGELSSVSCAACHASQFADWSGARHAIAMGPGVLAQMKDQPELSGMCASCHTPLQEQWTDDYLSSDGVSCSACHARAGQKFGPPPLPATIPPLVAGYPAPHGPVVTRDFFERSDFCAGCHQFAEGRAPLVNGAFLQNTMEEWRASRAAREGQTCQSCHMPGRRHLFRGIHDPATVRSGVGWHFEAQLAGNRIESRLTLTNTGTGHAFPTYVVPEVSMRIETVDQYGLARLVAERLIARRVVFEDGHWREIEDTRLDQDETATLDYSGPIPSGTTAVVGSVVVRPDAFHVSSLGSHLRQAASETSRRLYEQALAEMRRSDYVLFREVRRLAR